MTGAHEFVDETKPPGRYILAATAVEPALLSTARAQLRAWRLSGNSSIHFTNEREDRRKVLLSRMLGLPVVVRLYVVHGSAKEAVARGLAMERLATDIVARGAQRLVLERDDSMARGDRQQLARLFRYKSHPPTYAHLRAKDEHILWVSDAVAWCYQRGGEWPTMCSPIVNDVVRIAVSK